MNGPCFGVDLYTVKSTGLILEFLLLKNRKVKKQTSKDKICAEAVTGYL